jgi:hypothetical protein
MTAPPFRKFPVHQLTGPGEFAPLPVLPSFLYIPGEYDIADQDMAAPWTIDQRSRDDRNFAGALARDHGAKVPARAGFFSQKLAVQQTGRHPCQNTALGRQRRGV